MIPLIDSYLKDSMEQKFEFLRNNPELIKRIFGNLGKRTTLERFTEFFKEKDIKTIIGYPREANQLPCFVITLAGEQEVYTGIGDNTDEDLWGYEDDEEENSEEHVNEPSVSKVNMDSTYRIECWSDNGDLTFYMYTIAKWALLSARTEMVSNGILLPKISAADLEPVPDYFPIFVYRRALMISFQYENQFYENEIPVEPDNPTGITEIKYIPHYYVSE